MTTAGVGPVLEHLFASHLSPAGRRYTLREVSAATGLSLSYISMVRRGAIRTPSGEHLQRLASFFGVDVVILLALWPRKLLDQWPLALAISRDGIAFLGSELYTCRPAHGC